MATQPRDHNQPGGQKEPEKKHPYVFYWLTGGLTAIIVAIITVSLTHSPSQSNGPTPGSSSSSPGPDVTIPEPSNSSSGPTVLSGNGLLTSDDMGETAGGLWSPLAVDAKSLSFSCFPLPGSPLKSAAVELESASGAKLWEVVDTFSSTAAASQAYMSFANTVNNCSWQTTSSLGTTTKSTAVPDSNAPSLATASGLWDIEGAPTGSDVAAVHDGAIIAVQSGKFVAFAQVFVDYANNPSLTVLETNTEPAMDSAL
jgi:hypothetical protein